MERQRCAWAYETSPHEIAYHDTEWGVPAYGERQLFEMLILEGAQAGLSWRTILDKREGYRRAFAGFDPEQMIRFSPERRAELLLDAGIVRNRLKIDASFSNASALLALRDRGVDLAGYLWGFVDGQSVHNHWREPADVPVTTPASEAMSRDLKRCGFRFVGPTICYAFMQAVGMVNDHLIGCFRHAEISAGATRAKPT
ncbi:DNA-3-methyladenine glycosylase [Acidihalobacter yilgarnensis]|uniref:DNA-3-methyladenine glycosylase n=1 Tax=Acidihalobacter yilgarnensis TaxID=2819280 RepID=A0A1D8IL40_9GAMM|nr:DNA-3-methyladenine glycosylase I [Acidihalobacter yilgarnensis]AOU97198.1 DNA-3-methyladenine glycosylase [Acidihalobacter yilgarnensis]